MKNFIRIMFILFFGFFLSNEKTANAQSQTFNYTGSLQNWTVPCGVTSVTITCDGAQGGGVNGFIGGYGAQMIGTFTVNGGEKLTILVGGAGTGTSNSNSAGGGGGGSFVMNVATPLIIAGGGGGRRDTGPSGSISNTQGTTSTTAQNSYDNSGIGGTAGNGGNSGEPSGGGTGGPGGGLNTNGGLDGSAGGGWGMSYTNGGAGGAGCTSGSDVGGAGGYGGGGGGTFCYRGTAGGGGGYSGGGTGINDAGAGGGGSYNAGTNQNNTTGFQSGNGQVTITWTPVPALTVTAKAINNVLCNAGTDGKASATVGGGSTPYTYSWAPSGGTKDTAAGLSAATYTVTVKDACANMVTASVTITQPTAISASASVIGNVLCNGGNGGSANIAASGGTPGYTYLWSDGETTTGASNLSAGMYTVKITDKNGCSLTDSTMITQPAVLSDSVSSVNILCNGDNNGSATATVNGGTSPYMYAWTPSGGSKATASGLSAGTYTLAITDSNGCTTSATATITEPTALTVTPKSIPDDGKCTGSAWVTVSGGTAPYAYKWSPGGQTTDSIMSLCQDSTYCCTITDKNGCTVDTVCETIVLGIPVISQASSINIYPNPNTGYFNISGVTKGEVIELYNYMGEKLSSTSVENNNLMHIDISDKVNGIYLVKIENRDGSIVIEKKIMKVQ